MKYLRLKERTKELAVEIKELKSLRKDSPERRRDPRCKWSSGFVIGLDKARYEARHHHIAYCLLRGRSYSQIEKPKRVDKPNMSYVSDIMERFQPREVAHA